MKNKISLLILSIFSVSALASCGIAGTSSTSSDNNATPLQQEVASLALLTRGGTSTTALQAYNKERQTKAPISIASDDVSKTLASFDALSLENYTITSETQASDKAEYSSEEILTYTNPDQSQSKVYLYYGSVDATGSSVNESATSAEVSSEASASETSVAAPDSVSSFPAYRWSWKNYLHGQGYLSGAFNGLLRGGSSFINVDDNTNSSSVFKTGLAIVDGNDYYFASEVATITKDEKSFSLSAFVLVGGEGNFLSVEQAAVQSEDGYRNVYAYTSLKDGQFVRYLLQEKNEDTRLAYLSNTEKIVIHRFADQGKTYYSIHLKEAGAMNLAGLYEKVVTTAEDGTQSITYVRSDDNETAPQEA